jgi:ribose 5-phosphate isomerase RpiB
MKISGNDHAGPDLKKSNSKMCKDMKYNYGTDTEDSVDYPDFPSCGFQM